MSLPRPGNSYDPRQAAELRRELERRDQGNHKRGQDVEINPGRLILTSPNGTRFSVTVSNAGAITATPI